jgi:hypothetical protein
MLSPNNACTPQSIFMNSVYVSCGQWSPVAAVDEYVTSRDIPRISSSDTEAPQTVAVIVAAVLAVLTAYDAA